MCAALGQGKPVPPSTGLDALVAAVTALWNRFQSCRGRWNAREKQTGRRALFLRRSAGDLRQE